VFRLVISTTQYIYIHKKKTFSLRYTEERMRKRDFNLIRRQSLWQIFNDPLFKTFQ